MTKQKFYETVDKYLMAMGIDVDEYSDLSDLTFKQLAFNVADEGRIGFDVAYDIEEMFQEEPQCSEAWRIPDVDCSDGCKEVMALCRKRDEQQYLDEEVKSMCRSILAKILFSCDANTLARAGLSREEKEFLIAYDFKHFCFREPSESPI